MFVVNSYTLAVVFCFVTMLCWGSWGNTQKLAGKTWRYDSFTGTMSRHVLFSLLIGLTMGSFGSEGRSFLEDLAQADPKGIGSVILGGIIFNASNILLSASVSLAGLSVAFPLGVGLALVIGVIVNYIGAPKGDPVILFLGVALIVVAIICNGIASGKMNAGKERGGDNRKGILLAVLAGVLDGLLLPFRGCGDGSQTISSNPDRRYAYALFGHLHLLGRCAAEQLRLQYLCYEASVRRNACHL